MSYPVFFEIDGDDIFVWHPDLPGCHADGRTFEEAEARLSEVRQTWLEVAAMRGMHIPAPWHLVGNSYPVALLPQGEVTQYRGRFGSLAISYPVIF